MANQKIPTTDTVEDITVEKIILSGTVFQSSILGHGAHLITADAAPVFFRDPIISGPEVIGEAVAPPLLTCEAESFTSAPRATLAYQWKRGGVDIGGATSITYTTVFDDIETTITCEVVATNSSGSDTRTSNGIVPTARIPSIIYEMDVMALTGMAAFGRIDVNYQDVSIITGLEHIRKIDTNEAGLYAITGFASDAKQDVDEADLYVITGYMSLEKEDINALDLYVVTGVGSLESQAVNTADVYVIFLPSNLDTLVVVNGDAENANMGDWTIDSGNVTSVTTAPGTYIANHREGSRFFMPEDSGQGGDSQMSQVIVIPGGDLTDVDTGKTYVFADFIYYSDEDYDKLVITLEALDAGDSVLDSEVYTTGSSENAEGWLRVQTMQTILNLPTLTRKIKITILFDAHATLGTDPNSVYIDDISIPFVKMA